MAPVAIAVAGAALTAGIGVGIGAVTVSAALLSVAATAIAAGVSYLTAPSVGKMKLGASVGAAQDIVSTANQQRNVPISQPIPPRRFAYGNCRNGGVLFFEDNANPNLCIGVALSDGTIESVDGVYFGETLIPVDGSGVATSVTIYDGRFKREWTQGLTTQTASAVLLANFPTLTSDFRQRGVARLVCQMDWGADAAGHNTLWGNSISPSAVGKWLRCYDPRDGTQDPATPSTWKYTSNPVLHVAHALTNAWGVALDQSVDFDWVFAAAAANVCDSSITVGSQTLPMFRGAGFFEADTSFGAQIADMLTAFRGRIIWKAGKYGVIADQARSSVWTVTEDDLIELGEFTSGAQKGAAFSSVCAKYFDTSASDGNMRTTAVYKLPSVIAAEGDRRLVPTLAFTPDNHSAQIIAYRELLQTRDGRSVSLTLSDAALYLIPSDVITIAFPSAPFLNGLWTVEQVDMSDVGAVVSLSGYNPDVYADPTTYLQ